MNTKILMIHHGELTLKKRNRSFFEDKLESNISAKLRKMGVIRIRRLRARFVIEFGDPIVWESLKNEFENVFGFSVAYPVCRTLLSMDDLGRALVAEATKLNFKSFAVQTKRANKKFPLTSPEISAKVGALIQGATGARVDLENPERTFYIEILDDEIFFSFERFRGPGGLPVGISGHVVSLISGGIDSPVASWMMMKRGVKETFIHFHSKPFTNDASIEKVEDMVELLSKWQGKTSLALVPFGNIQQEIVTKALAKYRVILYRRFMLRIATRISSDIGAGALVTGESLGQVASQTLTNIGTVESVTSLPILRPLIGMDKQEIVDKACKIGTYNLSIQPHQDCCSFLQPPNPVLISTNEELKKVEDLMDVENMENGAIESIEWKSFNADRTK